MRDPNRIDEFCDELKKVWKTVPDWRFMQLMCNLQSSIGGDGFYMEEAKTMAALKNMVGIKEEENG